MSDILDALFSLKGKTALVTGGGGAIGRVLARGLASGERASPSTTSTPNGSNRRKR